MPKPPLSRREFARGAACLAASATLLPALAQAQTAPAPTPATTSSPPAAQPALSAAGRAEVEAKFQSILTKYGARLSAAERADIRRLLTEAQGPIEVFRAFPLENANEPAHVFQAAPRLA